ncbi:carbohydrate ABC transporter permease [Lachnoclostridium sp. Marseille-P6806]|uniref:carbohydrate ABC transporter permease n=1 Tax=Lachnoclostridium sp. Marseille-P6806 TaxID=2364793 RepID=UPI0013EF0E46|nr:sugar ABC transporter permease [Lachnoclostridium sp. Marseille-P6806]
MRRTNSTALKQAGGTSRYTKEHIVPYLFVLPAFLLHLAVVFIPSLSTFVMALFDWNGMGAAKFIGFQNFVKIFHDKQVSLAIIHNMKWLGIFITVPIILGFSISLLVSRLGRTQMLFRTIYFIPYVISAAVAGKIWTALMNPYYGVNEVFAKLGWAKLSKVLWLGEPKIALYAVAFVDNWHWWGFIMILFLSALQQVDPTLYEAARVDGATRWQEIIHVAVPGVRSTIAFILITTIMWSFLTFDYVYVMTNGGPANATEVMATYIYKNAFVQYRAGYANALCVIQSAICVGLYFFQKWVSKKGGLEDD